MATPQHRTHAQRVMKFIIFEDHYYTLSLYEPCPGLEEKIFKEINQFYTFTSKLPPLGVGSHEIYNFLSPYHTDATSLYCTYLFKKEMCSIFSKNERNKDKMQSSRNKFSFKIAEL